MDYDTNGVFGTNNEYIIKLIQLEGMINNYKNALKFVMKCHIKVLKAKTEFFPIMSIINYLHIIGQFL